MCSYIKSNLPTTQPKQESQIQLKLAVSSPTWGKLCSTNIWEIVNPHINSAA